MARVAGLCALVFIGASVAATGAKTSDAPEHPAIQQFGRAEAVADTWKVTWPGVTWRTAFKGRSIAVVVHDALSGYRVQIDGRERAPILAAEQPQTAWYGGLSRGKHSIEVVRQTATRLGAGEFGGFRLGGGGYWLPAPTPAKRQIEFLGDSWSTGYGNLSSGVQCADDAIPALSDATQGYAIVTARRLHADWQLNAVDGIGIARNWHGIWSGQNYATYYARTLETDPASHYDAGPLWYPQVVVVWLGANDFVAPIAAEEGWTDATLDAAFERNYRALLAQIRQRIGAGGLVVVMQPAADANLANSKVPQLVATLQAQGDRHLVYLPLPARLQRTACDRHPSVADGRLISEALVQAIQKHLQQAW